MTDQPARSRRGGELTSLALLFLRLGATSFGGPAAHVAILEDEVVRRRGWMTSGRFLDLLAATHLIPGPNSTEMAIHVGRERAGVKGLLVAGAAFILPAALLSGIAAWGYVRFGALPEVTAVLHGIHAAIVAVVFYALFRLARTALRQIALLAIGVLAAAAVVAGVHELLVLLGAGIAAVAIDRLGRRGGTPKETSAPLPPIPTLGGIPAPALAAGAGAGAAAGSAAFGLSALFFFFLKVGSVLFGSGYVLLAFLRADLVERWGWLTERQLLDAIAVGQVMPGPLFTTATFIGYVLAGAPGAIVATVGIFLPAFAFVAASGPLVARLRASRILGALLDGVVAASLALMAVVTFELARSALVDVPSVLIALASAAALIRFRVNTLFIVLGGGLVGLAVGALR